MKLAMLFLGGVFAGSLITIQNILNAALGRKTGSLGSVLVVTLVSAAAVLPFILTFPKTATWKGLPGAGEWYLYLGGVFGIAILATSIFLTPRVGATTTLTALVMGQLLVAVVIDHFGLFDFPRIEISLARLAGVALLVLGAVLIVKK